jgi:hypothetical protein
MRGSGGKALPDPRARDGGSKVREQLPSGVVRAVTLPIAYVTSPSTVVHVIGFQFCVFDVARID